MTAGLSRCDQEMCPFWDGGGCPCRVLDIDEERRENERRRLGYLPPGVRLPNDVFLDVLHLLDVTGCDGIRDTLVELARVQGSPIAVADDGHRR